jgi:hypothetical protein
LGRFRSGKVAPQAGSLQIGAELFQGLFDLVRWSC